MADSVNNPTHYSGEVECIEAIKSSMSNESFKGYLKGNIIKYIWRYERKNGTEDLLKCQWYVNRLVKEIQNGEHK